MKLLTSILFTCILISCQTTEMPLAGDWEVHDPFYKAVYRILPDSRIQVLQYDDGTFRYHFDGQKAKYLAQNLLPEGGSYIDAASGATQTKETQPSLSIKVIQSDSLTVTSYELGRPIQSIWTRIK